MLSEVLRNGAEALLAKAVEAAVADFLERYVALKTAELAVANEFLSRKLKPWTGK